MGSLRQLGGLVFTSESGTFINPRTLATTPLYPCSDTRGTGAGRPLLNAGVSRSVRWR
jgi:hypothetical protein